MMDLDIEGPISCDGLAHSFGGNKPWDSISAFGLMGNTVTWGVPFYYDHLVYDDGDAAMAYRPLDVFKSFWRMWKHSRGDELIPVRSGFCALALYKMYIFTDKRDINYTAKDGVYYGDHNMLHNNMIACGYNKIFINPNMLLLVGVQGPYDKYPLY
jgi:hypothetical protein